LRKFEKIILADLAAEGFNPDIIRNIAQRNRGVRDPASLSNQRVARR